MLRGGGRARPSASASSGRTGEWRALRDLRHTDCSPLMRSAFRHLPLSSAAQSKVELSLGPAISALLPRRSLLKNKIDAVSAPFVAMKLTSAHTALWALEGSPTLIAKHSNSLRAKLGSRKARRARFSQRSVKGHQGGGRSRRLHCATGGMQAAAAPPKLALLSLAGSRPCSSHW